MRYPTDGRREHRILTVPNCLTACRILLIPFVIWAYCIKEDALLAFEILCLSALTDIIDGYIARQFHMVTAIGKALDPIADKLTQATVLICLTSRFPIMLIVFGLLALKEIISGCMCLTAIRKTKEVQGADWHGKLTTCLLYLTMVVHILWETIPKSVSISLVAVTIVMMVLSFGLYFKKNMVIIRNSKAGRNGDEGKEQ